MKIYNKIKGDVGEIQATKYLKKLGYKILETKYKNLCGEIDIIAREKRTIVFIEVKARSSAEFGLPREAVTTYKQNKIRKVALSYLKLFKLLESDCRFDVIDILDGELTHIKNAF